MHKLQEKYAGTEFAADLNKELFIRSGELEDELNIIKATVKGYEVPTYDDGWGKLYLYVTVFNIAGIVRANNEYDAYDIIVDNFLPKGTSEEIDEEGWSDFNKIDSSGKIKALDPNCSEWPTRLTLNILQEQEIVIYWEWIRDRLEVD